MKRKDAPTPVQGAAVRAAHDAATALPELVPGDDDAPSDPRQARADLVRLWRLFLPYWRWMMGGAAVALAGLLANVGLLALSGWFVSAMAIAGAAGAVLNYFTPAAVIRAFAITRTGGRYA